jgi:hypothetical protein
VSGLDADRYANVLRNAHLIRNLASNLDSYGDLDAALQAIDRADAVGSILDPTAYRDNARRMHEDRATLSAVRDLARLGS